MDDAFVQEVWRRAGGVCEYCRIPQALFPLPFHLDHIIAQQHGGPTKLSNLALACLHCNSHKGPNLSGLDPVTRKLTPLFNPRRHKWDRHVRWEGPVLIGKTAIGRVTILVLAINGPELLELRTTLFEEGLFPPS